MLIEPTASGLAYDVLEDGGHDIRAMPLRHRRDRLMSLQADLKVRLRDQSALVISEEVTGATWDDLAARRASRAPAMSRDSC